MYFVCFIAGIIFTLIMLAMYAALTMGGRRDGD